MEDTPSGYPRLAAFQSSEANFALYRSFSYLHSRVLLDLQDEITDLEKQLDEIDWDDSEDDPERLHSRETDVSRAANEEGQRNRRVILKQIREKLEEYGMSAQTSYRFARHRFEGLRLIVALDKVLINARTLESFQRPSDRNYRSVRRYHYNEKPLMDSEMDSIRSKEDIVSLSNGREWATFDSGVETVIHSIDGALSRVFKTKTPPLEVR